jgi:hypothetical protein
VGSRVNVMCGVVLWCFGMCIELRLGIIHILSDMQVGVAEITIGIIHLTCNQSNLLLLHENIFSFSFNFIPSFICF